MFIGLLFIRHTLGDGENDLGSILFVCATILGPLFGVMMFIVMPLYSYAYNLSHLTGAFGDRAVMPHRVALELSAEEVEGVLARRALDNLNRYGHSLPSRVLTDRDAAVVAEEADLEAESWEDDGNGGKRRKKPMKRPKVALRGSIGFM